jgi:hypothetical protein
MRNGSAGVYAVMAAISSRAPSMRSDVCVDAGEIGAAAHGFRVSLLEVLVGQPAERDPVSVVLPPHRCLPVGCLRFPSKG